MHITPLPEKNKSVYMKELIHDATSKGAEVVNSAEGIDSSYIYWNKMFRLLNIKFIILLLYTW